MNNRSSLIATIATLFIGGGVALACGAERTTQIFFQSPDGMRVQSYIDDQRKEMGEPLITPGRQNFAQGDIHRILLDRISGRGNQQFGVVLEVTSATVLTKAFLKFNAIPVRFTDDDFDHALSGREVVKAIYLSDEGFGSDAIVHDVEVIVSWRLNPSDNAIVEAGRRGAIVAVVRLTAQWQEKERPTTSKTEPRVVEESQPPVQRRHRRWWRRGR